jgi:hypothetical protein
METDVKTDILNKAKKLKEIVNNSTIKTDDHIEFINTENQTNKINYFIKKLA